MSLNSANSVKTFKKNSNVFHFYWTMLLYFRLINLLLMSKMYLWKKRCTFVSITSTLSSSVKRRDIWSTEYDMPGGWISIREAWFDVEWVSWTISLPLHHHLHLELLLRRTIMVSNYSWLHQVEGKIKLTSAS